MPRLLKLTVVVIALIALAALALAGCAGTPSAAPSAAPIKVGLMGGLTGPAPAAVQGAITEWENVFKYMNKNEGGIMGHPIEWKVVDNKGTPDGAIIAYKELRDSFKPHLFMAVEDYYLLGARSTIDADKSVIFVQSAMDPRIAVPPGYIFSLGPPVSDAFASYLKWVKDDYKGTAKPKVGVLHWDLPSGQQYRIAQPYAAQLGIDLVPASFSMTAQDLKPQLMQVRDAGVNYIWVMAINPTAAVIIRDARALGLAGKTPITFFENTEPEPLLAQVGDSAEGFLQYHGESPWSDQSEAAKEYTKIWAEAGKANKWSDNRIVMNFKYTFSAAVNQAIKDVTFEKLGGEAIYNALNKMATIDTKGNASPNFGFGPNRRVAEGGIKMARYTKTGTVSVSDWILWPGLYEKSAQATAPAPAK
jgi:ABC-type branched-subunit amino acid transport system substrate-binding protein